MHDCLPIGTIPHHVHRYTLVYAWHLWPTELTETMMGSQGLPEDPAEDARRRASTCTPARGSCRDHNSDKRSRTTPALPPATRHPPPATCSNLPPRLPPP